MIDLKTFKQNKIIAVIRQDSYELAKKCYLLAKQGGIKCVEFSFTMTFCDRLLKEFSGDSDMIVGCGTVTDIERCKLAIENNAKFILTPNVNLDVIDYAIKHDTLIIPGVMTPTDIANVLSKGINFVKIFPASLFTPKTVNDMLTPFGCVEYLPSAGVTLQNAKDWLTNGASMISISSGIFSPLLTDESLVIQNAQTLINNIK